jgi:TP901 family phage tail tape measure protein
MADLTKTIQVIFSGKDNISGTLKTIGSGIDDFAGGVNRATQPLADLTKSLVKMEAALIGIAVAGLAVATREAGKFGDSFTLIDVPRASLEDFKTEIIDYARSSTQSFDNINEAIYSSISAGVDYTKALDTLEVSEKLAIATKGELSDTTLLLSQTINAYGGNMENADRFAALYFQTIKSGVTRIDELASSMGKVTPVASALNIPLETLSAALVALTKSGLNTSEAVTTLSSLLTAFLKGSTAADAILGKNAESFTAANIKAKGFEVALQEVITAVGDDDAALQKLLGRKEAFIAALILGKDTAGFFKDALAGTAGAAENFAKAYEVMTNNFANHNQMIVNNIRGTLIEIGTPLLNEYGELAKSISKLFDGLSIGIKSDSFDELFAFIEGSMLELADFFDGIAER